MGVRVVGGECWRWSWTCLLIEEASGDWGVVCLTIGYGKWGGAWNWYEPYYTGRFKNGWHGVYVSLILCSYHLGVK